ncbi:unnamed protein product, partial [Amoebophrya sp. A25]|eukprot:GSA25T00018703001.1
MYTPVVVRSQDPHSPRSNNNYDKPGKGGYLDTSSPPIVALVSPHNTTAVYCSSTSTPRVSTTDVKCSPSDFYQLPLSRTPVESGELRFVPELYSIGEE